jgi:hypothetical protein
MNIKYCRATKFFMPTNKLTGDQGSIPDETKNFISFTLFRKSTGLTQSFIEQIPWIPRDKASGA